MEEILTEFLFLGELFQQDHLVMMWIDLDIL